MKAITRPDGLTRPLADPSHAACRGGLHRWQLWQQGLKCRNRTVSSRSSSSPPLQTCACKVLKRSQHQQPPDIADSDPGRSQAWSSTSRRAALVAISATIAGISTAPSHAPAADGSATGAPKYLDPNGPVMAAVQKSLKKAVEKAKAPVVLRLAFHDAGTWDAAARDGGANASVRFELGRSENFGLKRGWRCIEAAMAGLRGTAAEGAISQADMIALAGAHAVAVCGGPAMRVPIGRRDAVAADPEGRLPEETLSAAGLRSAFAAKGFSTAELVTLFGAHTLGAKGFGEPLEFSNVYYRELLRAPWDDPKNEMASMIGLPSDRVLPTDPACRPVIEAYAADQARFFDDFAAVYLKLMSSGAVWV